MDYLQPDIVKEHIKEHFSYFSQIWRQYHRGCLSSDDCRREIENIIWKGCFFYINEALTLNFNQHVWDIFLEEYRKIEQGILLTELHDISWLNSKQWDETNKIWVPASAADRTQALRLMQAFRIPPEYFVPLPDDTPIPQIRCRPSGGESCVNSALSFECVDDGGLLSCKEPCGKTFTLKNELGLKAVITIKEKFPEAKEILHNRASADYRGEGYVEGYTEMSFQREDPSLYIQLWRGKIDGIIVFISNVDNYAYHQYPMWQDYFSYLASRQAIFIKVVDGFLEDLLRLRGDISIPPI